MFGDDVRLWLWREPLIQFVTLFACNHLPAVERCSGLVPHKGPASFFKVLAQLPEVNSEMTSPHIGEPTCWIHHPDFLDWFHFGY